MDALRPNEVRVIDIRDVDYEATQVDLEGRGHTDRDQCANIVPHEIDRLSNVV
jgi:hypothetical protein